MMKKILVSAFIFIFLGIKAQTSPVEISTGSLTEESISKTVESLRKRGIPEWEIQIQNNKLHKTMRQQQLGIFSSNNQKGYNPPPQVNSSGCTNPGFEDGTTNGWTLYSGDINSVSLPCNTCANTPGAISNVVNPSSSVTGQCTSGSDKYGSFPVVAPGGGGYSLLLNDANSGGKMMRASYSFVVGSANDLFTFRYAAVLNSGGTSHLASEQPYFHVDVTDNTLNTTVPCTQYDATAPSSGALQGWVKSSLTANGNSVYYKSWTTIALDLQTAIGHTVTVNFIVSDCSQGGHFGYCYIDADCGNPSSASSATGFCGVTSGTVTMTAPSGYSSYQWYGPAPNYSTPATGTGANTQTLTTTAAIGDTFLVAGTGSGGCISNFKVVIKPTGLSPSTSSISSCRGGSTGSASVILAGGGNYNYSWTGSGGAIGTNTATISNLPTGTYSVHITDPLGGCPSKDTIVNVLTINPTLQTTSYPLCGTQTTFTAPAGSSYNWYDPTNTLTGVTTQTFAVNNASNNQHYIVTYNDATTHCLDSVRIDMSITNITFTSSSLPSCSPGNTGSLTFYPGSGNNYTSFDWSLSNGTSGTNTAPPISIPNLGVGTYTMTISVPGNASCQEVLTSTVVASAPGVIPVTNVSKSVCTVDTLIVNPGVTNNSTHSWSGNNISYPTTTTTLTITTPFTNTVTSFYTYTDTIKTVTGGCISISVYKETINVKSFTAKISIIEPIRCYDDSTGKLKAIVSNEKNGPIGTPDKYTFSWLPANLFASPNPATATGSNASSTKGGDLKAGTYTCVVTNGNCIETAVITLVSPPPLHTDSLYAYYCPKDSLALLIADTGNTNYVWHPSNSGATVTGDSAFVPVQNLNNYYVTYNRGGCADTAKIIISVTTYDAFRPDELVNVFSPNGDKKNDFFYPFYSSTLNQYQIFKQADTYELHIYDRWGKSVYDATDYSKPWDGKTKSGHDADAGTYFFIVKYKSNCGSKADLVENKGFLELVR